MRELRARASSLSCDVDIAHKEKSKFEVTFVSKVFNAVVAGGISRARAFQLASLAMYLRTLWLRRCRLADMTARLGLFCPFCRRLPSITPTLHRQKVNLFIYTEIAIFIRYDPSR